MYQLVSKYSGRLCRVHYPSIPLNLYMLGVLSFVARQDDGLGEWTGADSMPNWHNILVGTRVRVTSGRHAGLIGVRMYTIAMPEAVIHTMGAVGACGMREYWGSLGE